MRRQGRYNKNHKSSAKKERIIMAASSVFVLAALTMTGVYVKSNSEKNLNDGYHIDFSALEEETEKLEVPEFSDLSQENVTPQVTEDDLDYMPMEQVDSGIVQIPGLTDQVSENIIGKPMAVGEDGVLEGTTDLKGTEALEDELTEEQESLLDEVMPSETDADVAENTGAEAAQNAPGFASGDRLVWPVTGSVLIPYSMDKTVYFATLQQYKYNPALIVAATEGDDIQAAVSGTVTEIFYDEEIGDAVVVDIGKGYEITYGQLKDIAVSEGDYVEKGEVIGLVAAPTKYYSVEGANAYFALTLDGVPVDPLGTLE